MNHQSMFTDFNWSKDRLSVSFVVTVLLTRSILAVTVLETNREPEHPFIAFLFQVLFHHMFLTMIEDIGSHVVANNEYSLEFIKRVVFLFVYIRF